MEATPETFAISSRTSRIRKIAYWFFTLSVAFENTAGSMWVLVPLMPRLNQLHAAAVFAEYLRVMLAHLGYPAYFQYILGPWQLACAAVLLAPQLGRAKEWAYIGAVFNYSSALASHLFAGDPPNLAAAMMLVFTVASWALRPPDRRLAESKVVADTRVLPWFASAAILILLAVLSLFWLPKFPTQ